MDSKAEILLQAKKLNIAEGKVCFAISTNERKKCFAAMQKPYYPAEPNTACEAIYNADFSDYLILVNTKIIGEVESCFAEVADEVSKKMSEAAERETTTKLLLQVLKDFLNGQKSEEIMVTEELCRFAKMHEVLSIVYYQTKSNYLEKAFYSAVQQYAMRTKLLKSVATAFGKSDIPYYFVKGAAIYEDYPVPQLRTMGDCDIHLKPQDKEKASAVMREMGFTVEILPTVDEWHCKKDGFLFELHDSLCYEQDDAEESERAFLQKEWEYVHDDVMEREFHFIYLLSHLKKHLIARGVGFRQFMDLAVEINTAKLDFDKVLCYAEEAGLKNFLLVCLSLCEKWFGITVPCRAEITDSFASKATGIVAAGGVFGYEQKKDESKEYSKYVRRDGKIKTLLFSVFLPYNDLVTQKEYHWLKGKPFLLPFAWFVRIFKQVMHSKSRKNSLYALSKITAVETQNTGFSEWGL